MKNPIKPLLLTLLASVTMSNADPTPWQMLLIQYNDEGTFAAYAEINIPLDEEDNPVDGILTFDSTAKAPYMIALPDGLVYNSLTKSYSFDYDYFATPAQGALADTAVQPADLATAIANNPGPKGDTGEKGDKGDKGDTGNTGSQGIQGIQGATGNTGATGAQGPQGDTGPKGDTGNTGATGATGSQGPIGPTGATGAQGPAGTNATTTSNATTSVAGLMSPSDKTKLDDYPIYQSRVFNNTPSRSLVTTAAAANGYQISATRDYEVSYSVTTVTTATIGGASSGYIVLEIATTNSSTASDWKEIARSTNGQTITLAVALQSVQTIGSSLTGLVPAGYYARIRSVTVSGTPSFSYTSGQEYTL